MPEKAKIIFDKNGIKIDMKLEEIVALISTGDRDSPEYGLTFMILSKLVSGNRHMKKDEMYDLYMRNREHISKASFYRILKRLITRGMILFNEQEQAYMPSVIFSNSLQKIAIAWEKLVIKDLIE
ncbi:MAG: hypothetical protein JXA54_01565 [Candidatus Heimdallarchaeota archaeon]|nr:hypothetical protein [Candidatus Heimdallarchaeota archaeon]